MIHYRTLLNHGTAPEIARMVLPQSMMTEFIETASLAAYARLFNLRNSPDAQYEIRRYAEEVGKILAERFPVAWRCLTQTHAHTQDVSVGVASSTGGTSEEILPSPK